MNNTLNIFGRILNKLRFQQPVPPDVQRFILSYKMKALIVTLKRFGEYNVVYGFVVRIYFYIKRVGFSLSVVQVKLVLGIIFFIIALAVSAGILFSADFFEQNESESMKNKALMENLNQNDRIKPFKRYYKSVDKQRYEDIRYRLGVKIFESEVIDKQFLIDVTDSIAEELIRLKGKNRVINLRRASRYKSISILLIGSVEKLGDTYIITARLVDVEKTRIMFVASESVDSSGKLKKASLRIARRIADSI